VPEEVSGLKRRLDEIEQGVGRAGRDSIGHPRTHGSDAHVPRNNYSATAAPGTGDDAADGYGPGSEWVDVTNDAAYVCLDGTAGAAVWTGVTGGTYSLRKEANQTVNNSAALQDDDELLFAVAANEEWIFHFYLFVSGPEAGDINVHVTGPSGSTVRYAVTAPTSGITTGITAQSWMKLAHPNATAAGTSGIDDQASIIEVWGLVRNGATAGDCTLQWAQAAATLGDTIVYADSWLLAVKEGLMPGGAGSGGAPDFDDATSDPLIDADAADDGTENSPARKDHVHPKHHARYTDAEAQAAVGLDEAYDSGGAGAGRTINVDSGLPILLSGVGSYEIWKAIIAGDAGLRLAFGVSAGLPYITFGDGASPDAEAVTMFRRTNHVLSLLTGNIFEVNTINEINGGGTGVTVDGVLLKDGLIAESAVPVVYVLYRVLDPDTSQTVGTTVGGDLEIPVTGTITEIGAYVDTAGTTGTATIDVNKNGTTLMTTNKITIDTGEKSSRTAATAPALTTTSIAAGDLITVDVDAIHTTAAKGLTVRLGIRRA
jgi:hypothetical protein